MNQGTANSPTEPLRVDDLHPDVTEAMLFDKFSAIGPVLSIRVCRDLITRRSLGYAYVHYQQLSDAERAIDTLNYDPIKERPCRITWPQRDPTSRRSGVSSIFVKNLDKNIDNKGLYDTFSAFGNVLSCNIAVDDEDESKGYGFVHYKTKEAAHEAIAKVNGMMLNDKKVFVEEFMSKRKRHEKIDDEQKKFKNVVVKNFGNEFDLEKLKEKFGKFGEITSCVVMTGDCGKSKGFAFVAYDTHEAAEKAVAEMDNEDLDSNRMKVFLSEPDIELKINFEQQKIKKIRPNKAERATKEAAHEAIAKVNSMMLNDKKVFAGEFMSKRERHEKTGDQQKQFKNVFVKNFGTEYDIEKLAEKFERFGEITSCVVMMDDGGKSKGFGFVAFDTHEAAEKAVAEMDNQEMEGKKITVCRAKKKEEREMELKNKLEQQKIERISRYQGVNLYIKNLEDGIDEERLRTEFSQYGTITSAKVMSDHKGKSIGFGFVCFSSPDEATKAVTEMNGRILMIKPLYVAFAQRKEERRAQLSARFMK